MSSSTRYEVDIPAGTPTALFLSLYAEELRKKLAQLLALRVDQVVVKQKNKEKFCLQVTEDALSGMQVVVEKKFALGGSSLRATVEVNAFSKFERLLMGLAQVLWVILAIPTFFLVLPVVRFIILSFFVSILLLTPFMFVVQLGISFAMSLLYSVFGNSFDEPRRAAITGMFQQAPVPDPLAAVRKLAVAQG